MYLLCCTPMDQGKNRRTLDGKSVFRQMAFYVIRRIRFDGYMPALKKFLVSIDLNY